MADNVTLNSGSGGAVAAADDIGSVLYQRVKPNLGADGTATDAVPVSNGMDVTGAAVQAVGLVAQFDDVSVGTVTENQFAPVRISSRRALLVEGVASGTAQPISGTVTADLGATDNAVLDDIAAKLATIDADTSALAGAVGGTEVQVDVLTLPNVTLAAGTNTNEVVGDAAHDAAAAGNPVLMGAYASAAAPTDVSADADAVRVWALRSGAVATQPTYAGILAVAGNGAAGTGVQRVTLANDSTGIIASIGTSVTPGTAAANLGKAEDAAHASGDTGVMALAVRAAAPTERSAGPTDGDYEPLAVNEVGALWNTPTPSANGGLSIFRSLDIDETEEDVKTSAGNLYGYYIMNVAATTRYVKFYNATAANVTVGTTTPVLTIPVPAGAAANLAFPMGVAFATAISVAATTGVADADTGAPAANDVIINVFYK